MQPRSPVRRLARRTAPLCLIPVIALGLAGCGGGGGGSSSAANSPPVLTGNLNPTFAENEVVSFFLSVDDADGDTVTVTVGNSSDGRFFTLDTASGEIRSTQPFDFEMPLDANGDNVYEQTVTLNDGTTSVMRTVRVRIENADEPPTCVAVPDTSVDENVTGVIATLAATDPDAGDDAIAVWEGLMVDDMRLNGLVGIDAGTGAVSLIGPLDAEAFAPGFRFIVTALYRTNNQFDVCSVTVALNDLPTRVTSGILFTDNKRRVQLLGDVDGGGTADFWIADNPDETASGPIKGVLVFGETLAAAMQPDGGATIDPDAFGAGEAVRIAGTFPRGLDNATTASVQAMADLDGDGRSEVLFMAEQPPSDGLSPVRRPWGYVIYAAAIAGNTSGNIDLDALPASDGFSLTGPVDLNGFVARYALADLDGNAGDEIVIATPEALGTVAGQDGKLYVLDGAALAAASGNFDFDLEPTTREFRGIPDFDPTFTIGAPSVVGDLSNDGIAELVIRSRKAVAVIPSANLIGSVGGAIDLLNPLLLTLAEDFSGAIGSANVDGDGLDELLIVRGDGSPGTEQAGIAFGAALQPIVDSGSEVPLDGASLGVGGYLGIRSTGEGFFSNPVTLTRIGDLDGDGRDEVAFGLSNDPGNAPGSIYILRGSVLAGQPSTTLDIDSFTAADGTRIASVPFLFNSLTSKLSLAPDLDGDGLPELYVTSNQLLQADPPGLGLVVLSSDVAAALAGNAPEIDLETLFFNET